MLRYADALSALMTIRSSYIVKHLRVVSRGEYSKVIIIPLLLVWVSTAGLDVSLNMNDELRGKIRNIVTASLTEMTFAM